MGWGASRDARVRRDDYQADQRTAEVTVRAEDEDAAWEKVEDAFGEELEELVEGAGGWRDAEAEYEIEEVNET